MPGKTRSPALHLIVCHAEPAAGLAEFIAGCQELGWQVHAVAATADAVDPAALAELTGHPVRTDEQAETLHPLPPADAYAVAPASFDLVNKWAYGFNDNLALRLLNEATSIGLPVVAVPAPDPAFARHPAFLESLERLRHWGVAVTRPAEPGDADDPAPWHVAVRVVAGWTRFARVPAQQPAEPVRGVEELALQSG